MEVARRNLEEATTMYARIGENLYGFSSGDSDDASRLTLVDRILDFDLASKPVAMVPTGDQLFVTGSDDELGLRLMADLAGQDLDGSNYPGEERPHVGQAVQPDRAEPSGWTA